MHFEPIPLFSRQRPYYIVADDYSRTDSRARVMHQLCHALNLVGAEAYILPAQVSSTLRTPTLSALIEQQHKEAGVQPIVVYPEQVQGNPLQAPLFVRYAYRDSPRSARGAAMCFLADPSLPVDGEVPTQPLEVPLIDTAKFNPGRKRGNKWLAYTGGYPDARRHFSQLLARCELIDDTHPATSEALVALLRGADRLYCFGQSALALEAALCGCPVVYIAAPGDPAYPASTFRHAADGFATDDSPETLERVRGCLSRLKECCRDIEQQFPQQLREFIHATQSLPVPSQSTAIYEDDAESMVEHWANARATASFIGAKKHQMWRTNRSLQEIDGQLMAERMVRQWPSRPIFHLLTELRSGEEALLADTLDTLEDQLYPDWQLTIVSPFAPPDDSFPEGGKVRWLTLGRDDERRDEVARLALDPAADWCALIQPGVRLEPYALQMLGDYIATHPLWCFIYTDEDLVNAKGALFDPRFKPDLNLDLLRSIDYLGAFCIARVESLALAGGIGLRQGAETYDMALRLLDRNGASALGHVPEVLYHSPATSCRELQIEAERHAVRDHLARLNVDAQVQDGHGYATRRIVYRHSAPKVSVVILTRDKAEYLGPCLDSLFGRTHYPNFEVIILDAGGTDPEARALIDRLRADPQLPLRVLRCDMQGCLAVHYNAAAAAALGEYLLFLDDDCVILQNDWLDRLVASACRPEVGIVGPRFASPGRNKVHHAGLVLGFRGPAGAPYGEVLAPESPGYLGFKTLDQNVSAISPACVLVRASLFRDLGGFRAESFPNEHAVLDLCLRVDESRRWIVWTPYVTLASYGNGSRAAWRGNASEHVRETDKLLGTWLPTLARDPFYNRNLSLIEAYQPEHRATVNWDVNFRDRQRVIGFPLPGGSGEYRVVAPFRAISRAGLAQTSVVHSERRSLRVLSLLELARAEPDVVVVHQAVERWQIETLTSYRKYLPDIFRVTGLDDLISLLPPKHPRFQKRSIDILPRLRAGLSACDRVVVSTEPLADLCRPLIDDVVIMPNCLEWELWGKLKPYYSPQKKPRVGWIGAQQHYGDLEHIFEVVAELANEVDWIFMGMCPPEIRVYVAEYHPWTHGFSAYASKMAALNLDLAIAPLDINPFNEAKSNLRLLEYGAMNWPVVCTDIFPYQNAPVTRVPNSRQAWAKAIREKLSDRDAARREGEALRAWVEESYVLEKRLDDWLRAFSGTAPTA